MTLPVANALVVSVAVVTVISLVALVWPLRWIGLGNPRHAGVIALLGVLASIPLTSARDRALQRSRADAAVAERAQRLQDAQACQNDPVCRAQREAAVRAEEQLKAAQALEWQQVIQEQAEILRKQGPPTPQTSPSPAEDPFTQLSNAGLIRGVEDGGRTVLIERSLWEAIELPKKRQVVQLLSDRRRREHGLPQVSLIDSRSGRELASFGAFSGVTIETTP